MSGVRSPDAAWQFCLWGEEWLFIYVGINVFKKKSGTARCRVGIHMQLWGGMVALKHPRMVFCTEKKYSFFFFSVESMLSMTIGTL